MHATGVLLHLNVLGLLLLLGVEERLPQLGATLLELLLSVGTVSLQLGADTGEGSVELECHLVELGISLSLILSNEVLELFITLKVFLVALVANRDHAGHLGIHIGVDLGLGGGVGAHH